MQTNITQVSPVEYELEIHATADELAPDFKKALRTQQGRTQLKGFRPGKVPTSLVKKMYGQALAYELADQTVQKTYEEQVLNSGEYQVLGQPKLTRLEYEMDGDLQATIRFGTRPAVTFEDLSDVELPKLVHRATDEDVDSAIERLRRQHADLVPVEDAPIGPEDQVVADMQQVDEETGTLVVGSREEDTTFFLDDERLHDALRNALVGKQPGDTVRVELPHGHGDHVHTHLYEVSIKEVKRRELPEVDDEFAKELTNGQMETVDALRKDIAERLQKEWDSESRELLEGMMVQRLLDRHPVPVPESIVETFLDYFVDDVKRRNKNELPDGFDEEAFRGANREEAERQARWMILRDALVEQEGLEVTEADLDAYFEDATRDDPQISPALLRQYYQQMDMLDRIRQNKLSEQVHEALQKRFKITEKEREAYEAYVAAENEKAAAREPETDAQASPEEASEPPSEDATKD